MRTNVVIDDEVLRRAMKLTGLKTKRSVVDAGLRLLVELKSQAGIRKLRGKVEWHGNLDEMRRSRIE